jgi:NAD dependent epimerase/dehydratase family
MKVIITGVTGMVGEGVMHVCLNNPEITEVLIINRKPYGLVHSKLKEIIHSNFFDLSLIENQVKGYDACFFCLGVSSVGMSKPDYFNMTYTLTIHAANVLAKYNPNMAFCYISGAGTDSTEKGTGWPAVKGKTENEVMKLFKNGYAFRPGFIQPMPNMKHTHPYYKYINWLFPIGRMLYSSGFCKLTELANAMIYVAKNGSKKHILEGNDIIELGNI